MSAGHAATRPMPPLPPGKRWARRLAPLAFVAAVGVAVGLTLRDRAGGGHSDVARASGPGVPITSPSPPGPRFSHTYPSDPVVPERGKVSGPDPVPPPRATVSSSRTSLTSFAALSSVLPKGTLVPIGPHRWRLTRPAGISDGASLRVAGPATLQLAPGSFLVARHRGLVVLRDLRVVGVDAHGRPLPTPTAGRGFLAATVGGRMRLIHDRIVELGYLGKLTYGISFRRSGPGSGIFGSSVVRNYFGVYMSASRGVRVIDSRFAHSVIYGIDPHTFAGHLVIRGNTVVDSGVHGIILAQGVHDSVVEDNVVRGAELHGIVVYDHSNGNVLAGNRISGTFDGIVVQDSSGTRIVHNVVDGAKRFALRVTGVTHATVASDNSLSGALVGLFVYAGPTGNRFVGNHIVGNVENVRIRLDATGNVVRPVPPRSELRSK
jgi:parallel beta-helix repeat protein